MKGMGEKQLLIHASSRFIILNILSDKQEHRYNEIVTKSKLSNDTVSKHLKDMEGTLVEKRIEFKGSYPYPVYYRYIGKMPLVCPFCGNVIQDSSRRET